MLHWVIYYHCLSYVHPFFSGLSHFIKGAFYSDQAAKWGWRFFIILFHLSTRFISSRIWRTTISDRVALGVRRFRIESHLKSDDFRSSRIWRATISDRVAFEERRFRIESHLKSDDFGSSRVWRATISDRVAFEERDYSAIGRRQFLYTILRCLYLLWRAAKIWLVALWTTLCFEGFC